MNKKSIKILPFDIITSLVIILISTWIIIFSFRLGMTRDVNIFWKIIAYPLLIYNVYGIFELIDLIKGIEED